MKKFIKTLKNIWTIDDLRNKIIITLALIFVYRLGSYIVLPGIDPNKLTNLENSTKGGMLGLLDAFVGGAFS
ncbi:MAG: preprotein translocase subunit SecY, partial [Ginsengibacter sp.]